MHVLAMTFNVILMLAVLAAALYAHVRIPHHTATAHQAVFSHLLLVVVGLAAGWSAAGYAAELTTTVQMMAFATAFGLVHVPAAFILYSKRLRGISR